MKFDRADIVDAFLTYAVHRDEDSGLIKRMRDMAAMQLSNVPSHKYGSEWEAINYFSDNARAHYFALVAKKEGQEAADALRANYDRIHKVDGVTIQLSNCGDDPFEIMFEIHDVIADAWADANGSICGGTWECPDKDKSFVYDIGSWYQGVFEELKAEGYDLDFSNYNEPEANDMTIADHLGECGDCEGTDFSTAEKHIKALKSVVVNGKKVG